MAGRYMDGVRAYIRDVRDARHITQQTVADSLGIVLKTYTDWENGRTEDIKGGNLVAVVDLVEASIEDVAHLYRTRSDEIAGKEFAQRWLQQVRPDKVDRIVNQDSAPDVDVQAELEVIKAELRHLRDRMLEIDPSK